MINLFNPKLTFKDILKLSNALESVIKKDPSLLNLAKDFDKKDLEKKVYSFKQANVREIFQKALNLQYPNFC
jgi:hypothetical protein